MICSQRTITALPCLSIPADALTDIVFRPLIGPELRSEILLCQRSRSQLPEAARILVAEIMQSAATAGMVILP